MDLTCFKAYDIRGHVPNQLNETVAYLTGFGFVSKTNAQKVAVGYDARKSSLTLSKALIEGLTDAGANVYNLGLSGTEEGYFAAFNQKLDGAFTVTGSHNPIHDNGIKIVKQNAKPLVGNGITLPELRNYVEQHYNKHPQPTTQKGQVIDATDKSAYIEHLLTYVNTTKLTPLKIVLNAGNGTAGPIVEKLASKLQPFGIKTIFMHTTPDGTFPNGIPNPMLPENRAITANAVKKHNANLGVAFDGDNDRCFVFDENGGFVSNYYLISLLAKHFIHLNPNTAIVHDPRQYWGIQKAINTAGGTAIISQCGHTFFKDKMAQKDAVFGAELSGHYFFKNFGNCDSGMIPWLVLIQILAETGQTMSSLVANLQKDFATSDELNTRLRSDINTQDALNKIELHYKEKALTITKTDGIDVCFKNWRFSLRASNTEPVIRLNLEAKTQELLKKKQTEVLALIAPMKAQSAA